MYSGQNSIEPLGIDGEWLLEMLPDDEANKGVDNEVSGISVGRG